MFGDIALVTSIERGYRRPREVSLPSGLPENRRGRVATACPARILAGTKYRESEGSGRIVDFFESSRQDPRVWANIKLETR